MKLTLNGQGNLIVVTISPRLGSNSVQALPNLHLDTVSGSYSVDRKSSKMSVASIIAHTRSSIQTEVLPGNLNGRRTAADYPFLGTSSIAVEAKHLQSVSHL